MSKILLCTSMVMVTLIASPVLTTAVNADAICVGESSLIGTLDYSDTFTTAENGGNSARPENVYPLPDPASAALVENVYGNPQISWSIWNDGQPGFGNIVTDSSYYSGTAWPVPYPGPSGAGSATGIAQNGNGGSDINFGIPYDIRNVFTVQFDMQQHGDRVNLTVGAQDFRAGDNGLSLFFRNDAVGVRIGLYNPTVGEYDTGFYTGITLTDLAWHNYGATFDLDAGLIDVYVNEDWKGQIDLKTISEGAYWAALDEATNDYISLGRAAGGVKRLMWTDNFQVGTAVPEPSTVILLLGILASLAIFRPASK